MYCLYIYFATIIGIKNEMFSAYILKILAQSATVHVQSTASQHRQYSHATTEFRENFTRNTNLAFLYSIQCIQ